MPELGKERAIEGTDAAIVLQRYFSPDSPKVKRTFVELRLRILLTLTEQSRTINDIAGKSGINWRTVELHLTHLLGKRMVEEGFSSQYVRIFAITLRGKEFLEQTQQQIRQALGVQE